MQKNELLQCDDKIVRILDVKDGSALIINCLQRSMPKWFEQSELNDYSSCTEDELAATTGRSICGYDSLDKLSRRFVHEHFTLIAGILPFISDDRMLLQTICATGIHVSELQAITVESLNEGQARIYSKAKLRLILIPKTVCRELKRYCKDRQICSGSVFITKSGKPIDRSNIWKMMKRLAQKAKVQTRKAFPHNLRHLFACTYYEKYQDIVRLADILGHSSINTTRIYTKVIWKNRFSRLINFSF